MNLASMLLTLILLPWLTLSKEVVLSEVGFWQECQQQEEKKKLSWRFPTNSGRKQQFMLVEKQKRN